MNKVSDEQLYNKYLELDKNKTRTAEWFKKPRSTVQSAIKRYEKYLFLNSKEVSLAINDAAGRADVSILKKHGLDPSQWRIEYISKNEWETPFKDKEGNVEHATNKQTKVLFKKLIPDITNEVIKEQYKMLSQKSHKVNRIRNCEMKDYLYEIAIADQHFGKLCWAAETGETYDIKIAKQIYIEAVADLLDKVVSLKIDRILLPIGNDLFTVDGIGDATTAGTHQDTDSRFTKIFRVVSETMVEVINMCAEVANVDVLIVAGNHDRATCFYLGEFLAAWFNNDSNVSIKNEPTLRKYYRYGNTLLGFTHGSEEKQADLPLLMAREAKEDWSSCSFHEIHTGHLHKKKLTKYISGDTFNGVMVRILDSLTATDAWHYSKGYVKGIRAATGIIFHKEDGYVGEFSSRMV